MPWVRGGRFWVGRHATKGIFVVARSSIGQSRMDAYFVEQNRVVDCDPNIMRERARGGRVSETEAENAVAGYRSLRSRELEIAHMRFLRNNGQPFAGTRFRSDSLPQRQTHCWSCHCHLDSSAELECMACGWLLCECGACGCGR